MASSFPHKPELPPLLQAGLHRLTMNDLRNLCVAPFPTSTTRPKLFEGFCKFRALLTQAAIALDIWVDGSFLTEKIDPSDVDLVMKIEGDVFCSWSAEQQELIFWLTAVANETIVKAKYDCHCFAFVVFPPGHPDHHAGQYWYERWKDKDFGRALRSRQPKGIAVVDVSDGRHLRLRSHKNNRLTPNMFGVQHVGLRPLR